MGTVSGRISAVVAEYRCSGVCVADAGLPPEDAPRWLRHTCATLLMEGDVDLWEASSYLGMNPKALIHNYSHHRPSHHARAGKALG